MDPKEAAKFSYGDWWVEGGSARPLHALNLLRVPLVRNALLGRPYDDLSPLERDSPYPLEGKRVLDIGCGAGILCEVCVCVCVCACVCVHACVHVCYACACVCLYVC